MHSSLLLFFPFVIQCFALPSREQLQRRAATPETAQLSPAASVPAGAAAAIDGNFIGWAFEGAWFPEYAGPAGSPNGFSQNVFNEVSKRTNSGAPVVHVGAITIDSSTYVPSQQKAYVIKPGQTGINLPRNSTVGPSYFKSFNNLNARYVLLMPLHYNNLSNTLLYAKAGAKTLGGSLYQLEIGNEPNANDYGISASAYASRWTKFSTAISKALGNGLQYVAISLTSPPFADFTAIDAWNAGISNSRGKIEAVALHYYQSTAGKDLQTTLMNHAALVSKFAATENQAKFFLQKGIPVRMNEVGAELNPQYNDNSLGGVLGTALWQADFLLYTMSLGFQRVNLQQGLGFAYSAWQPVTFNGSPPKIRAPFYSAVFAADWLGTSGALQTVNMPQNSDYLAAYAGYEGGKLTKVAAINLNLWSGSAGDTSRPRTAFSVNAPAGTKSATVRFLNAPTGGRESDSTVITWNDLSWSYAHQTGYKNANMVRTLKPQNGKVTFHVPASAAAILEFNS